MESHVSPLQAIKQKELDLRLRVEEARRQAEARIRAAHEEASRTVALADEKGRAEAEACYARGIEQTRQEAEAIAVASRKEAGVLRQRAMADDVARQIVELVLPRDSIPIEGVTAQL